MTSKSVTIETLRALAFFLIQTIGIDAAVERAFERNKNCKTPSLLAGGCWFFQAGDSARRVFNRHVGRVEDLGRVAKRGGGGIFAALNLALENTNYRLQYGYKTPFLIHPDHF